MGLMALKVICLDLICLRLSFPLSGAWVYWECDFPKVFLNSLYWPMQVNIVMVLSDGAFFSSLSQYLFYGNRLS